MPSHKTTPKTVTLLSPELLAQARSGTGRKWAAHALSPEERAILVCAAARQLSAQLNAAKARKRASAA